MSKPFKRVLWAVDAYSSDSKGDQLLVETLKNMTAGMKVTIEPVYVITPIPAATSSTISKEYYKEAQRRLERKTKRFAWEAILSPKTLKQEDFSQRGGVKSLIRYAKRTKADFIAVNSHCRTGLSRMFMGSFAETLFLQTELPVLLVNRGNQKPKAKIKKVFCPVDFSSECQKGLKKIVELCEALGAQITLFHQLELITDYVAPSFYQSAAYITHLENSRSAVNKSIEQLASSIKKQGVSVEVVVQEDGNYVGDSIVKAAKKSNADLIGMVSHTGAVASVVLGSLTRQVGRVVECPLWVVHPKSSSSKKSVKIKTKKKRK